MVIKSSYKYNIDYNYVLDIIEHFSKWYYGYLLKTKEAEEVWKKFEIYKGNFGKWKILQVVNRTEFKNKVLEKYCHDNNIKLVHSSPYHPQTNGVCEVVHKEIRNIFIQNFLKIKIILILKMNYLILLKFTIIKYIHQLKEYQKI